MEELPAESHAPAGCKQESSGERSTAWSKSRRAIQVQMQDRCFACGPEHPYGLRLVFSKDPDGGQVAEWVPTSTLEGFQGIIHGGIVATVLDEAMSHAVIHTSGPALTVHLEVRLRRSVHPGERLRVRGWVVERRKRKIRTEAVLLDAQGLEKAHAWATFIQAGLPSPRADGKDLHTRPEPAGCPDESPLSSFSNRQLGG